VRFGLWSLRISGLCGRVSGEAPDMSAESCLFPPCTQLRDELLLTTSDSPSALQARCKQLQREVLEEEERAARETAELADQVRRSQASLPDDMPFFAP
jgi:hypothetical protein